MSYRYELRKQTMIKYGAFTLEGDKIDLRFKQRKWRLMYTRSWWMSCPKATGQSCNQVAQLSKDQEITPAILITSINLAAGRV